MVTGGEQAESGEKAMDFACSVTSVSTKSCALLLFPMGIAADAVYSGAVLMDAVPTERCPVDGPRVSSLWYIRSSLSSSSRPLLSGSAAGAAGVGGAARVDPLEEFENAVSEG